MTAPETNDVAKPELGTKRTCPVTGKKFYDLNKDPIVSPFTGQTYARTMFEPQVKSAKAPVEEDEPELVVPANVEVVSLDEAEAPDAEKVVLVEDDIDVVEEAEEDDTFLEEDEEEDDDVADLIDGDIEDDEET